ncbi:MAG: NAD(+) kinase [Porticoccaceae bacterium]|jgi:NAD+ kinase|nr:NAD(+) kinase [Porticoccaceae bacterium]MEA3301312.1 NAD(+) kinase [Pseudomonadota bacterium]HLS99413.1 NAD(+) kinase [Porticoccaceae bacterium]
MANFARIGLVTRLHLEQVIDTLNHLVRFLNSAGWQPVVESSAAGLLAPGGDYRVEERDTMARSVDLVIVVGGDGSMLSAARDMVDYDVPLLGVNRGRLGFLTDILPHEVEQRVTRVLSGEYVVSDRFLLDVSVTRGEQKVGDGLALNDVVLHPGKSVRMMEFELYVDRQFVYSQRSDGLIVSTPTGSTAYALSAGGPIMHPRLDALVLVPMNPHTLTSRPIAVPGSSAVEIRVGERNELHPLVTCDGQRDILIEPGDSIRIRKKDKPLRLIHPVDHNFYSICRSKLGWGSRLDSGEYIER